MPDLIKPEIFDKIILGDNHKLSLGKKNLYNESYSHFQLKESAEAKPGIKKGLFGFFNI